MMLVLGVLSVFQLTLLPGLLLILLFPAKRSFIQQLVYLFMLSLLANYAGVLLLVTVKLYLRSVVLALFVLECATLVWLYRRQLLKVSGGWEKKAQAYISNNLQLFSEWVKNDIWSASLYFIFSLVALFGIIWVFWIWVTNFNTVFQTWDAWAQWDLWAMKWAGNRFPGDTYEYPQLIPVTFSLSYKFIGTTAVKFFGKSIMPLFTLMVVLMLFDLGRKHRSFGYMLGAGLCLYSIVLFLGEYIPEGYVDIPVASLSLTAIYTLLQARDLKDKDKIRSTLLLGSLSAAAAAVTKQTGLYVMAFYPFLAYFWVLQPLKIFTRREAVNLLAWHFLFTVALVMPWYAFITYRILSGVSTSAIQYVTSGIYQGQSLLERFVAAVNSLGNYVFFFVFALISLPVLDKRFRQILVLLVFPFSVLWALFLSYEHRNLAVALPLLSMTVGVATESWIARLRMAIGNRAHVRIPVVAFLLLSVALLGVSAMLVRDENMIQHQLNEQRQIFEPTLNEKIYRHFSSANGPEPIITSYPVGWLPGLETTWRYELFRDYETYQKSLKKYPDVTLLLVPRLEAHPRILGVIQRLIVAGTYQVIFIEGQYMLLRIPPRD